jgi:bacillithiol biosynthesis deacetylase BshB1
VTHDGDKSICELLVITAHPDDAELCTGGLLLTVAGRGWRTAVADLTRGELGSLGTPEIRAYEANAASEILGVSRRLNLELPDGGVRDTDDARKKIVRLVRELRPRIVVTHSLEDHHPDHMGAAQLVKQSFYLCGIRKYLPELPPWRPHGLLYAFSSRMARPGIILDISDVIERRMEAVLCYRSQFEAEPEPGFSVRIASSLFLESHRASLKHWGSLIGAAFGEPYVSEAPIAVSDPTFLFGSEPWKNR